MIVAAIALEKFILLFKDMYQKSAASWIKNYSNKRSGKRLYKWKK